VKTEERDVKDERGLNRSTNLIEGRSYMMGPFGRFETALV
jgi:hypothetical protein